MRGVRVSVSENTVRGGVSMSENTVRGGEGCACECVGEYCEGRGGVCV